MEIAWDGDVGQLKGDLLTNDLRCCYAAAVLWVELDYEFESGAARVVKGLDGT